MPSTKQQPSNIKHDVGIRPNICKVTFGPPCIFQDLEDVINTMVEVQIMYIHDFTSVEEGLSMLLSVEFVSGQTNFIVAGKRALLPVRALPNHWGSELGSGSSAFSPPMSSESANVRRVLIESKKDRT